MLRSPTGSEGIRALNDQEPQKPLDINFSLLFLLHFCFFPRIIILISARERGLRVMLTADLNLKIGRSFVRHTPVPVRSTAQEVFFDGT